MAALLKKRALAEYSQVILEPKPAPKRLKLSHVPKSKKLQIDIQEASCSTEALQLLIQLENSFPLPKEQVQPTLSTVLELLFTQKDEVVKGKLILLLIPLAKSPNCNIHGVIDVVSRLLKTEKSNSVISNLVSVVLSISQTSCQNPALYKDLFESALSHLQNKCHIVRRRCLQLIGSVGDKDTKLTSCPDKTLSDILTGFTSDDDSRVRSSAFEAFIMWHQRNVCVNQSIYKFACGALSDDYEEVRLAAVKLIWILCQLYPDSLVMSEKTNGQQRLVDDGFAKICNTVNDVSVRVRAVAISQLGSLHAVDEELLAQTLDKKLMSNLRKKTSAHIRQKSNFQSGEWATGKKWASDAPKEAVDEVDVTLMASGACGAFVHGLEDEFLEVRTACIDSLCELACRSAVFADMSQDYLVDMFNDEIEAVRLNAINSLRKIGHHLVLREDQLEIMLNVMKDFNSEIREALRDMLSHVTLGTKACMDTTIVALLDNLKRYPEDQNSILECMKDLGTNHPDITLAIVPELLSSHPYFESQEPDVQDPAYLSILTLVFNAAEKSITLLALLPDFAVTHYMYVRDTLPDLIPQLEFNGCKQTHLTTKGTQGSTERLQLSMALDRLKPVESMSIDSSRRLLEIGIRDLQRLASLSSAPAAGNAECIQMYLRCQLILADVLTESRSGNLSSVTNSQDSSLIDQLIMLTLEVEHRFQGLGIEALAEIRQLRLRGQTLQLLSLLRVSPKQNKSHCVKYLQILNQLQRMLTSAKLKPDTFTSELLSQMENLESCEPKVYLAVVQKVLIKHQPKILRLNNQVCQASATILEPKSGTDRIHKFTSGLITSLHFVATIANIENMDNVYIMVKYPDQQVHYIKPHSSDFRQLSTLKHRLVTEVSFSHTQWSEAASVQLSVVLKVNMDNELIALEKDSQPTKQKSIQISSSVTTVQLMPVAGKK